ncbi:hypothetical protein K437DRAFT_265668 [Tilletiaria anomala UBC 951]|uniref:HIG1 domain-containing protein n=1 Tax=Tilletiaria anomala (strain ATCC 24038 / CBS 436.72 / UBC 951) TaxID=1037660 RepID=A0A066WRI5_TILAU|nr:uncharacterized protein K437DRAFT_265668 [Tilletiaria anomala UBC 951]KDN53614.1 hypothetical protein K437DRAFT_265668 [Tilletiaria anomala UBC 951]
MASPVTFPKEKLSVAQVELLDLPAPESSRDKFWRKMKDQPLVPIGSLLTCGALIAASNHLRKGNRDQFQRALRWRVGLQGLTVVAAVAGSLYYGAAAGPSSTSSPSSTKLCPSASDAPAPSTSMSTGASTSDTLSSITTVPGRPATTLQASRAAERREEDRALLAERIREAIQKEETTKEREEISRQLAAEAGAKPRPKIGQDTRWNWTSRGASASPAPSS